MLTKSAKYYYDADAIKEPTIYFDDDRKARAQDTHKSAPDSTRNGIRKYKVPSGWDTSEGSHDDLTGRYEKKPVYKDARSYNGKHEDKQRGHGRRHAGFNDRWDEMSKEEQCGAMRNKRSVWTIATKPYSEAHFATFPTALIEPMIMAASRIGDIILDPFLGSGTTAEVAQRLGRRWIGCDLNPAYSQLQRVRTRQMAMAL
jgi:DNA modification methylase